MKKHLLCFGYLVIASTTRIHALDVSSDFSRNPLTSGGWSFGTGDNSNSQFVWDQPNNALDVFVNSSLPTARMDLPIGATLTMATNFTLTTVFRFNVTSAPSDQTAEFAFGLVSHALTGGDRTGSNANFSSDNTFNTVEFNYFPNVSSLYGGPSLTPTVFGAQYASDYDAFSNFASIFGLGSNIGEHTSGITALPQGTWLQTTLNYTAATELLTLTVQQINPDHSLTTLETDVPALDLSAVDPTFSVDSLAIMAYGDGFTTSTEPSLIGEMDVQKMEVTTPAPEPAGMALLMAGGLVTLLRRRQM